MDQLHPTAAQATLRTAGAGCEALETLPHSIGDLTSLRTLYLTGCGGVAWLPGSFSCLTALQRLSLAQCVSLAEVPRVSALSRLVSLDVGERAIVGESITTESHHLAASTHGHAGKAAQMRRTFNIWRGLVAENCKRLTALPPGTAELMALTKLDAFGCEALQTLPEHIGQLAALQDLDISHTALHQLPQSIGEDSEDRVPCHSGFAWRACTHAVHQMQVGEAQSAVQAAAPH